LICSQNGQQTPLRNGFGPILVFNTSLATVRENMPGGQKKARHRPEPIVDRWHLLKNWREALQRSLGRVHATLKQRQATSGVTIRPRYKKSRSSSEVVASQVARHSLQARYQEVVEHYQQGKGVAKIAEELHLKLKFIKRSMFGRGSFE
jgi:DNA-binding NarL/FixJ family response regulator